MEELNLQKFSWIDMDEFEMQLIEFQSSSIWKQRFTDFRVDLENIEKKRLEKVILERSAENELLRGWNVIPERSSCLKSLQQQYFPCFHLHILVNLCSRL